MGVVDNMKKLIEYGIIDKEYVDELENLRIERNWTDRHMGVLIRSHLKEQSISQEHFNWMVDQLSDRYKEPSKKQKLIDTFNYAIDNNYKFIVLDLTVPNSDVYETIIVRNPNFKNKLEYYKNAYDDDLKLHACKDIEIMHLTATNELSYGNEFMSI